MIWNTKKKKIKQKKSNFQYVILCFKTLFYENIFQISDKQKNRDKLFFFFSLYPLCPQILLITVRAKTMFFYSFLCCKTILQTMVENKRIIKWLIHKIICFTCNKIKIWMNINLMTDKGKIHIYIYYIYLKYQQQ